jgi:hypothetical protein
MDCTTAQPKQRSRITNHHDLLPGLMGTSSGARRFRDLVNAYISDMGGIDEVSEIKLGLLRRLASIVVQCETLEAQMVGGNNVDIPTLCTLASTAMRLSVRLGLERRPRDVTLDQYLDKREALDDIDIVQRLDDLDAK